MKQHSSTGSSLLVVIVITFLLSLLVLTLGKGVLRRAYGEKAFISQVKASSDAEETATALLSEFEKTSTPLTLASELNIKEITPIALQPTPLFALSSIKHQGWSSAQNGFLFSMRKNNPSSPIKPDWSNLISLQKTGNNNCSNWEDTPSSAAKNEEVISAQTCNTVHSPLTSDLVIPGNLYLTTPLEIKTEKSVLYVIVLGKIRLEKELIFSSPDNTRIEIISAGEIVLHELRNIGPKPLALVVHSAAGGVSLENWHEEFRDCSGLEKGIAIQVESAQGFHFGGQHTEENMFGCNFSRSEALWPRMKVLGLKSSF